MIAELEHEYPVGSDLTIMNTFYQYPVYQDGKKLSDDFLVLVYKNNETGKLHNKILVKPEYTYYKCKPGIEPDYNYLFIEKDKVDEVSVPFSELEKSIAEETGEMEFYKTNLANKDRRNNAKLHTNPRIFFSDVNIEDHYRFKFSQLYTNNINKINKSFFDIEVDGRFIEGEFPEPGECPINCVSFHDEKSNTTYTFILRQKDNPLIAPFEEKVRNGEFNLTYIRNFIREAVGGVEQEEKYGLQDTDYKLLFYDYEIELIRDLFRVIHECDPDFCEGWNSSAFDIEFIIERVINLGYDPADILCDQSWKYKVVKNFVDHRNLNDLAERGDYTFISGNTTFMDQMIQYASRRKSKMGSFTSFKLDDIGAKEAKVKKLDYHHITNDISLLPFLDFETFILYNIMDVTVQKCIEKCTQDLEYIFSKCVTNNTNYRKGHRQTIYLINRMASEWYKMGYIIGNNVNKWNEKPPKFLGALVGDSVNTNDFSKIKAPDGRALWITDNLIDFDFKSLYPSIIIGFNIATNTQIGRIDIPNKVYKNENAYFIEETKYSRGGEFIENLVTDNTIEFAHRWLHLASVEEIIKDIEEYFYNRFSISYKQMTNDMTCPIEPVSSIIETPIEITNSAYETPIFFYGSRPNLEASK
jgi:DNA polymerase elongation subunit (family B)